MENSKKDWLVRIILTIAILGALVSLTYPITKLVKNINLSKMVDVSLKYPETQANGKFVENAPVPFGINNPFTHPESDEGSGQCLETNSALIPGHNSSGQVSYMERHIEADALKKCIPNGVGYMENIKNIGLNLISQHFPRRYDNDSLPYFGLEEFRHRNHEVAVQLYINGFDNYFWAAINPESTKYFPGDLMVPSNGEGGEARFLPNSLEGFNEWQNWLNAMFDYLDAHNAADKLLYIQLGNESDKDYAKSTEEICRESNNGKECAPTQIKKTERDPRNPKHYYWSAYAKFIEKAYDVIKQRAPKAKIVIGTIAGSAVSLEGFQRPVLEYLAGKTDEKGAPVTNEQKKCGGTGCFDVYDYHDYSEYKQYRGKRACSPRDCEPPIEIEIIKSPQTFKQLINETGFSDKNLVVQQGGTYTGYDGQAINMDEYQTEEDQAAYLVKRAVYLISSGVKAMQFDPYVEHSNYQGDIHNWFNFMGLTYSGMTGLTEKCKGRLPCPSPGKGVKKLSWFSYKKFIATLNGSDWNNVESLVNTPDPETKTVFAYKFVKRGDSKENPVYVAWWDWWKDCPRNNAAIEECKNNNANNYAAMDSCVNAVNAACAAAKQPTITINVNDNTREVKITEAIPEYTTGQEAENIGYENTFNSRVASVADGKTEIRLGKKPVYVEENISVPLLVITNPKNGDIIAPDSKITIIVNSDGLENIKDVKFFINDEKYAGRKNKEGFYYYDWQAPSGFDQKYAIQVQAFDKQKNILASAESIDIYSGAPPAVSIVSPKNNDSFSPGQKITLQSKLSPANGGIAKIEFQVKDASEKVVEKCSDYQSDRQGIYACSWRAPKKSGQTYFIQAASYAKQSFFLRQIPASSSERITVNVK